MTNSVTEKLTFGDRRYYITRTPSANCLFIESAYGFLGRELLGFWKLKELKPTPNKSSVLSLAKTDKLI